MLTWQQPCADLTELRTIEMPCPNGCGGEWHHPAAENDRVVETPDPRLTRVRGHADECQEIGADFISGVLRAKGFIK
ncbi:hypothetical protein [Amycolatopsis sp. NPDC051372]|uniref:hypothetical protein n=1 Tax=Amycolatopsis sp. NPDC051372 TaxID=3155669 RepID=UPI003448FF60